MSQSILPENKNLNNKIKTFEQIPNDFSTVVGATDINNINDDSILKGVFPRSVASAAPAQSQRVDFGIEGAVIQGNTMIKRDDINMREFPLNDWHADMAPLRGLRNFDLEEDLRKKASHLDGRSSGILSEATPTYGKIVDQSFSLIYNPNSAKNLVMDDLPRGGSSTRF
jgi:hypothetical protein